MSDGLLSQEEINALLNGTNEQPNELPTLSESEKDLLGEVGNISMGSASTALSTLTNSSVNITTPRVSVTTLNEIKTTFEVPNVVLEVEYTEGLEGVNVLLIKITDASVIADLMMGGDGSKKVEQLSELEISAVSEAMNQMVGSSSTSLATMLGITTNISPPNAMMWDDKTANLSANVNGDDPLVRISFRMTINDLIDSEIMMLIGIDTAQTIVEKMTGGLSSEADGGNEEENEFDVGDIPITSSKTSAQQPQTQFEAVQKPQVMEQFTPQPIQQPVYQQPAYQPQPVNQFAQQNQQPVNVQRAEFAPLSSLSSQEKQNIDLILDVPLEISVVLGRTKKTIKEILELGTGSLIELDKLTEEPVEILVNGKKVAMGEVMVIDENFGVRITSIISNIDRVKSLQAK